MTFRGFWLFGWVAAAFVLLGSSLVLAQTAAPLPQSAVAPSQDEDTEDLLSQAEIEQLVAPIALYPDDLLSQIMMASTYPLEVVEAARWVKAHPDVTGAALATAMENEPWDPSVKSLTVFPDVLAMMNDKLSWMQQLGDAFLAQQEDVLGGVQALRAKADAEGSLKTTKQQTVKRETVTAASGGVESVYVIRPTNPEVVYVPVYDPLVVYGSWAYPAYQPYYWYPPGHRRRPGLWFSAGVGLGYVLWGDVDWRRRNVYINVNRYNRYNRVKINNNRWKHNARHRKGVPYRHKRNAKRYGKRRHHANAKAREHYRGRHHGAKKPKSNKPKSKKPPSKGNKPPKKKIAKVQPKQPKHKDKKPPSKGKKPDKKKSVAAVQPKHPKPKGSKPKGKKPSSGGKKPNKKKVAKARPKASKPKKKPAAFKGAGNGKQVKKHSARGKKSRKSAKARKGGGKRGGRRRG